jgi:carbon-monoxide dehydrogenase large subunit
MLGIPHRDIRIVQGDTDVVPGGDGTGGCRSIVIDGSALERTLHAFIDNAKRVAASCLEVGSEDVDFSHGEFRVVGTDRAISFGDVARAAHDGAAPLAAVEPFAPTTSTFPNGCHICEVEIDPDTGRTEILAYTMVHDAGRIINPMVVRGQLHGGVTQGIGQAMMEHAIWEADSGQMISGSFMDYAIPRADTVPTYDVTLHEIPTTSNPLGVKGVGEAGPTAAPPAVINAIVDALSPYGILNVPMPATPQAIWQSIHDARRAKQG